MDLNIEGSNLWGIYMCFLSGVVYLRHRSIGQQSSEALFMFAHYLAQLKLVFV